MRGRCETAYGAGIADEEACFRSLHVAAMSTAGGSGAIIRPETGENATLLGP
jgi:hypothetical protein